MKRRWKFLVEYIISDHNFLFSFDCCCECHFWEQVARAIHMRCFLVANWWNWNQYVVVFFFESFFFHANVFRHLNNMLVQPWRMYSVHTAEQSVASDVNTRVSMTMKKWILNEFIQNTNYEVNFIHRFFRSKHFPVFSFSSNQIMLLNLPNCKFAASKVVAQLWEQDPKPNYIQIKRKNWIWHRIQIGIHQIGVENIDLNMSTLFW